MDYILVMVTVSSREEAEKIAEALLEKKLIACANIFGPVSKSLGSGQHHNESSIPSCLYIFMLKKIN